MSKLLDPHICPDCRADLDHDATCTGCGLRLSGPVADRLWAVMTTADSLVETLRRLPAPASVAVPAAGPVTGRITGDLPPALPSAPPSASSDRPGPPQRLSAGSVPAVLFGVGALCLLIAAVVFVAVAWGSLGLGAKTTILLAVTTGFGALATRLTRRGLRGAAETFWLVTGTLVSIDLGAAYGAGLLGYDDLAPRYAIAVLGAAQVALGLGAAVLARRTDLRHLVVATLASTGGALLLTGGLAWAAPWHSFATTVSVLLLAGTGVGLHRSGLRPAAYGVLGVAAVSWAALLLGGLAQIDSGSVRDWWLGAECWPVLAAAGLAAAVTAVPRLAEPLRITAAISALLALVLGLLLPPYSPETGVTIAAVATVVLAGASLLLPRVWAVPTLAYAALGTASLGLFALARPLVAFADHPAVAPASTANADLPITATGIGLAPWTAIVVTAAVVAAVLAGLRWLDDPALRAPALRTWLVLGPTGLAAGVATAVLENQPTLLVAVVAWASVAAVLGVLALAFRGAAAPVVLLAAAYLLAVDLRLALPSHLVLAVLAAAVALALGAAHRLTAAGPVERSLLAAGSVASAALAATNAVYPFGGRADAAGIALVSVAVAAGLTARAATRSAPERITVEAVAFVCGLVAIGLPVDEQLAVALATVTGSAVALLSVLHRDRDGLAWLGAAILGAAALARVELGEQLPELATAPAAALLVLVGIHRLRSDAEVTSFRALGSGLTLALLPTLLLALDEPISERSLLLGILAVLALSVGIERHWAAPFLAGAGSLTLLAVRHLAPVAEAIPRWVSFGLLGAALLAVAVTWESRRRDLDAAERYLVGLR